MAEFRSLVTPWYGGEVLAGNCLAMAQMIVGAPVAHPSATAAANATKHRHPTRSMPNAVCVVWFDHWGWYGKKGQEVYANWGHVVIWDPARGFASSSPRAGVTEGPFFYSTLAQVEATFNATFRFWSEDLNGLRVCEPTDSPSSKETDMSELIRNPDGTIFLVNDSGMLDAIGSMREVEALQASGIVGAYRQMPDPLVSQLLTARTTRLKAKQAGVDPKQVAPEIAALLLGPLVAALAGKGGLTREDTEAALKAAMKDLLLKVAEG